MIFLIFTADYEVLVAYLFAICHITNNIPFHDFALVSHMFVCCFYPLFYFRRPEKLSYLTIFQYFHVCFCDVDD